MNIYDWLSDFDNSELSDYDREDQLREAVVNYNQEYGTHYIPMSMVRRYLRVQKWKQE